MALNVTAVEHVQTLFLRPYFVHTRLEIYGGSKMSFSCRVVSLSVILLAPLAAHATTLTGAGLMGTDATGNTTASYWNTLPGDAYFNLYLKDAVGFINSG